MEKESYTIQDTEYVWHELQKSWGAKWSWAYFIDYVSRTWSGEYRALIQKLPVKFGEL